MVIMGELLTLAEASERFNVAVSKLRFWRYSGKIRRLMRGNRVVVDSEEVRKAIEASQEVREGGH